MNPPSSSTSSSDDEAVQKRRGYATLVWVAVWLVLLDVGANLLFAYPSDPRDVDPPKMALYFDYGRSVEGRLRRQTRADPERTAPITKAGWYEPLVSFERSDKPGGAEITVYGMSHAVRLADALQDVSSHYRVRSVGAPGATTNWAYGAFLRDKERAKGRAAVLAIMSSNLPMILSPAPMDWNNSFPMPYTADRFVLRGDRLEQIKPPFDSFAGYVATLNDPAAWEDAIAQFAKTDPFYDPFLVRQTWLDNSTLVRLARRAWSQRRDRYWRNKVLTGQGFDPNSEAVRIANAIVSQFAKKARAEGIVPVIYIVDSFGYGDQLYRALAGTLEREGIPYLASHDLVDPMDPTGYVPDSHFTRENDYRLAKRLDRILDRELARGRASNADEEIQ